MASTTMGGASVSCSASLRAASMRGRRSSRYAASDTGSALVVVAIDEVRRVFHVATFGEELDPALRRAELIVAVAGERDATLEQPERLVERQIAVFELLDDLL